MSHFLEDSIRTGIIPFNIKVFVNMRQTKDTKLIPIGNSQGIRISKLLLQKYGFIDRLVLEETDREILIRKPDEDNQFSWEDTFKAMVQEEEDWHDLEVTLMDGLANDDARTIRNLFC